MVQPTLVLYDDSSVAHAPSSCDAARDPVMALRLSCPCGNKIILTGAPRERAGKSVACPACKRKLAIPDVARGLSGARFTSALLTRALAREPGVGLIAEPAEWFRRDC